ncbi:MAG: ribonuclease domain-containing protein [Thermodesulfovibrionales bacterium]
MALRTVTRAVIFILFASCFLQTPAHAEPCETVVHALNIQLSPKIDEQELIEVLRSLNNTFNRKLPPRFVTKRDARSLGWKPGKDLWSVSALNGSSIGGDRFRNLEARLPERKWREADLAYKGGHRGGKRIVFSPDGTRYVTVDHYKSFVAVPACR